MVYIFFFILFATIPFTNLQFLGLTEVGLIVEVSSTLFTLWMWISIKERIEVWNKLASFLGIGAVLVIVTSLVLALVSQSPIEGEIEALLGFLNSSMGLFSVWVLIKFWILK